MNSGIPRKAQNQDEMRGHDPWGKFAARSWIVKADQAIHNKKYDDAIRYYDYYLKDNPNDPKVWVDRGKMLYLLAKHSEAIESYEKAISQDPSLAEAFINKGNALAAEGNYDAAIGCYDDAIKRGNNQKDRLKAWYNKGVVFQKIESYKEAENAFENVIKSNNRDASALYGKALALEKQGRKTEAEQLKKKSNKLVKLGSHLGLKQI
jgi:tetratricopeptide (TPR) repeat protein